jgi:hypothetical protein
VVVNGNDFRELSHGISIRADLSFGDPAQCGQFKA